MLMAARRNSSTSSPNATSREKMMDQHANDALPEPPVAYRWHDTNRFGFAIAVPRRFHLISNTVDPVARCWRSSEINGAATT